MREERLITNLKKRRGKRGRGRGRRSRNTALYATYFHNPNLVVWAKRGVILRHCDLRCNASL